MIGRELFSRKFQAVEFLSGWNPSGNGEILMLVIDGNVCTWDDEDGVEERVRGSGYHAVSTPISTR